MVDADESRRRPEDALGVPWDGGTWVDADARGHWRPTRTERLRSAVILLVVLSVLGLLAAIASTGGDDEEPLSASASASTTTSTTVVTTTSTTSVDAASVGGEPPPPGCEEDDREGEELRRRNDTTVMVLNGTPRNGHAGASTDDLEERDYSTMTPGNAKIRPFSSIEYAVGFCAEAVRLAADLGLPDTEVRPLPEDPPVVLGRTELLATLGEDSL